MIVSFVTSVNVMTAAPLVATFVPELAKVPSVENSTVEAKAEAPQNIRARANFFIFC